MHRLPAKAVCAYRLFMPFASITVSTRECERVRDNLVNIAATKISAGVSTGIGSHVDDIEDKGDDQFEISDGRSVDEVFNALKDHGLQPVMNDYIYLWDEGGEIGSYRLPRITSVEYVENHPSERAIFQGECG